MIDIVERLRYIEGNLPNEAADEIESLRARVQDLEGANKRLMEVNTVLEINIEHWKSLNHEQYWGQVKKLEAELSALRNQEPVAWMIPKAGSFHGGAWYSEVEREGWTPLYTNEVKP